MMLSTLRKLWSCRWLGDRRGTATITFALVAIPLALGIGLALDGARIYLVRSKLGYALDTAALAGARVTDADLVNGEVTRIFALNYPEGFLDSSPPDVVPLYETQNGKLTASATTTVPTTLMRLGGFDRVTIRVRAVAQREQIPMELALVLDVTGSMAGSKIAALKRAANNLLDILYGPTDEVDGLDAAIVPFANRVNIGTGHSDWLATHPAGWSGCVETRLLNPLNDQPPGIETFPPMPKTVIHTDGNGNSFPVSSSCPPAAITPLTVNRQTLKSHISGLSAEGNTRIDMGAQWGWRVLSPRWRGLWDRAGSPRPKGGRLIKAALIMTDGRNEPREGKGMAAEADANLLSICAGMRAEGIIIYTIGFQTPSSMRPLLVNCASSPDNMFESPTNEELDRAFKVIANRLTALRLVE